MSSLYFITEDKLKSSERTDFGLPELKKYPMPDKSHVLAAIRMFNHVDRTHEQELASNIKSKMKKYGITSDQVGENNRLKQYLNESNASKVNDGLEAFYGILSGKDKKQMQKDMYQDIDSTGISSDKKSFTKIGRNVSNIVGIGAGSGVGMLTGKYIGTAVAGPVGGIIGMGIGNLVGTGTGDKIGNTIGKKIFKLNRRDSK